MIYADFLSQFTDWKTETCYWQRFSIAERYGENEINDTYKELFEESKNDYKLLTELVMILNHKSWEHCENIKKTKLCDKYADLFRTAYEYACKHLEGYQLRYFLEVTD